MTSTIANLPADMSPPLRGLRATTDVLRGLLNDVDVVMFDADGVLWRGAEAVPGAAALVNALCAHKRVVLCTNNSTKSRAAYAEKCASLGMSKAFNSENIVTSSAVVADYLKQQKFTKSVYLIGSSGIMEELRLVGIPYIHDDHTSSVHKAPTELSSDIFGIAHEANVEMLRIGCVVVGFDGTFNYGKLCKAVAYLSLNAPHCQYVATNTDGSFPGGKEDNRLIPGTGCMVAAVTVGIRREPVVVGKPHTPMFEYVRRFCLKEGDDPRKILMIGDNCATDIEWAHRMGMRSLLVLTGVTSEEEAKTNAEDMRRPSVVPDCYVDSIADLTPIVGDM